MIKPKHSFGKKAFEVKEEFIDREGAKQLYHDKLNGNQKEYNVLAYYGMGGIGKSKLKNEICRIHKEQNKDSIIFYLDLNAPEDRNLGKGILKMVDSCDEKIEFKCFELAYAIYFCKKNPIEQYGREEKLLTENTVVNSGLELLFSFDCGAIGIAAQFAERAIRAISKSVISREVKDELERFKDYSIQEMEECLPLFFQHDLLMYIKKHPKVKILMVFDTFEALNENVIEQIHRRRNERWVQEIITYFDAEQFPNLLFTIFGREKLEWDEDWQSILEQYELVEFENQHSREYLECAGVIESDIVEAIIESSRGYPFYLYLSLETYANIKNNERIPTVDDFGGSYPEIIERFIYNLDKDTVEILRLLSIPNFYNAEIFKLLISEFNVSFPMTEYRQFNKYSFVAYDEKEDDYYIHRVMRKEISANSSEDVIQSAHAVLLKYYSSRSTNNENAKDMIELFYHARMSMNVEAFNVWLMSPLGGNEYITPLIMMYDQQKKGEQNLLMQIINGIKSKYHINDLLIELVNIYIDIVHLGGDYVGAVSICDDYLSQFTIEQIAEDEQLLEMRIRKVHHSMFYIPVDRLIDETKSILFCIDINRFPKQYNELLFLLGGNLGVLSGDFDQALYWLNKSMEHAEKNNLETFLHRTIRKKADILLADDNYEGARNLISSIVSVTDNVEDIDSRYKIYLMGALGEVYRKAGKLDDAWHCYDIIDKKATENCMPGWQAHSYLAKGMVEFLRENYTGASVLFDSALLIYTEIQQQWGIINTELAKILLKRKQGSVITGEMINKLSEAACYMNYQYNVNFCNKLLEEDNPYLQLFFL